VGIGADGRSGLSAAAVRAVDQATVLAGSRSQLASLGAIAPTVSTLILGSDLAAWLTELQLAVTQLSATAGAIVVLATGDPLFFGIGRLLLETFPPEQVQFIPHVSSVQLAFARLKLPWQSATIVSVHGREPDALIQAVRQGKSPIAVLTDAVCHPGAIAALLTQLDPPLRYELWVCAQLGSPTERVERFDPLLGSYPQPNVVVLVAIVDHEPDQAAPDQATTEAGEPLPLFGLPDSAFYTFADRPGLITKQEIRVLTLAKLRLPTYENALIWDVGAGTGSIAIEIARLCPQAKIWAIEQTVAGAMLIRQNAARFHTENVEIVNAKAPSALENLPAPDRLVLGGGGTDLAEILAVCCDRLRPGGVLVANFATIEATYTALNFFKAYPAWQVNLTQVEVARSAAIGVATRFAPLNPVTLFQAIKPN